MIIRPATAADAPAVLAFWNPVIRDTMITFSATLHDAAGLAALIAARPAFLVAEEAGQILCFVLMIRRPPSSTHFRYAALSRSNMPAARGRGTGRALMAALEDVARGQGVHLLVAGVSGENPAGIAFHQAVGFEEAGRMREAGYKFGRYVDLVLMQKLL